MLDARGLGRRLVAEATTTGSADLNGVLLDLGSSSRTLLISCAGLVPNQVVHGMVDISRTIRARKLFLCDDRNLWYYKGIRGVTASFDETVELVGAAVEALRPERVVTMGVSGGGYLALALAATLGLDRALAFCPQTAIGQRWRESHGESRWVEAMATIHTTIGPEAPHAIADLIDAAQASPRGRKTQYHVVVSRNHPIDIKHATAISHMPGVSTYCVDAREHNVAFALRRRGHLVGLLETFVHAADDNVRTGLDEVLSRAPAIPTLAVPVIQPDLASLATASAAPASPVMAHA